MMSSNEPTTEPDVQEQKKRKTKKACDTCKRKKIGCDGQQIPGSRCSNCIASSSECSYIVTDKIRRTRPKGYLASLESRLDHMEKLLKAVHPDGDMEQITNLDASPFTNNGQSLKNASSQYMIVNIADTSIPQDAATPCDDNTSFESVTRTLEELKLVSECPSFFGKSSQVMLVKTALDIKNDYLDQNPGSHVPPQIKRLEFWSVPSWERPMFEQRPGSNYIFPDDDLMADLIDLYFTESNCVLPLLHRPTFQKYIEAGLHKHDDKFGAVVLLVCAIGSRFSDDSRVFIDETNCRRSCGWKWFNQVRVPSTHRLTPPSLYDVQLCCLSVIFLYGSCAPHSAWSTIGIGVRFAQDIGAHRRKPEGHKHTVQDELWKRAFWVLVTADRHTSVALGRPCAVREDDYDLDLPIECDDEYWEHPDPEKAFTQPPGKPSTIASFNCSLRLGKIMEHTLHTVYSIHKPKNSVEYDQKVVAELDSQLNQWVDSVPDHLRWDPNREDPLFFRQSASLFANYHYLEMLIHRPFISAPSNPSRLTFPCLAIITTAARTCCRIIQKMTQRGVLPFPPINQILFCSALVLFLHIWGGKSAGFSVDASRGLEDVHICMKALKLLEDRWHNAGRFWDILAELACVGNLPLPKPSPPSNKRERDQLNSPTEESEMVMSRTGASEEPRRFAGSRRVASRYPLQPSYDLQILIQDTSTPFTLSTSSDELGNLSYSQSDTSTAVPILDPELLPPTDVIDHLSYHPIADNGSSWPTDTNTAQNTNQFFYDRMAAMFSTPFGKMTEEELAMAIINGPSTQTLPNDEANAIYQELAEKRNWGQ